MYGRCTVHLHQSNTISWPTPQNFTISMSSAYAQYCDATDVAVVAADDDDDDDEQKEISKE